MDGWVQQALQRLPAAFPWRDLAFAMALLPSKKLMVYVLKVLSYFSNETRQHPHA
jgi:hypothetical protein